MRVDLRPLHRARRGARPPRSARAIRSTRRSRISAQASRGPAPKILALYRYRQARRALECLAVGGARALPGGERSTRAISCSRRCFVVRTTCASSRRRSSGRCCGHHVQQRVEEAMALANDTAYKSWRGRAGPGAARAPTGSAARSRRGGSGPTAIITYPAHAAFGGYKQSGIGRENHQDDARSLSADQEAARLL